MSKCIASPIGRKIPLLHLSFNNFSVVTMTKLCHLYVILSSFLSVLIYNYQHMKTFMVNAMQREENCPPISMGPVRTKPTNLRGLVQWFSARAFHGNTQYRSVW